MQLKVREGEPETEYCALSCNKDINGKTGTTRQKVNKEGISLVVIQLHLPVMATFST